MSHINEIKAAIKAVKENVEAKKYDDAIARAQPFIDKLEWPQSLASSAPASPIPPLLPYTLLSLTGLAYAKSGQRDEAERVFLRAARLQPDQHPAWKGLLDVYTQQNALDGVTTAAEKLIKITPPGAKRFGYRVHLLRMQLNQPIEKLDSVKLMQIERELRKTLADKALKTADDDDDDDDDDFDDDDDTPPLSDKELAEIAKVRDDVNAALRVLEKKQEELAKVNAAAAAAASAAYAAESAAAAAKAASSASFSYSCRKCRKLLFWDSDLMSHALPSNATRNTFSHKHSRPSGGSGGDGGSSCSSYFIERTACFGGQGDFGEDEGPLLCTKCKARVGYYVWSGGQCSCGQWIVPAFQVPKSKVDERAVGDVGRTAIQHVSFQFQRPPAQRPTTSTTPNDSSNNANFSDSSDSSCNNTTSTSSTGSASSSATQIVSPPQLAITPPSARPMTSSALPEQQ